MVLALLALFAVADTTLPAEMLGLWVNADTVVTKTEIEGENGPEMYTTTSLYRHVLITDSTFVDTVVQEGSYSPGPMAYVFTTPYRVEGGRVVTEGDSVEVELTLEGDTLTTVAFDSAGAILGTTVYIRAEPMGVPPDLVGFWIGDMVEEQTGVVFSIGLRFHPDATMEAVPNGEPTPFVVMGPFLLFDSVESHPEFYSDEPDALEDAGITTYEQVIGFEVEGDWLRVRLEDTDVVMQRRRGKP